MEEIIDNVLHEVECEILKKTKGFENLYIYQDNEDFENEEDFKNEEDVENKEEFDNKEDVENKEEFDHKEELENNKDISFSGEAFNFCLLRKAKKYPDLFSNYRILDSEDELLKELNKNKDDKRTTYFINKPDHCYPVIKEGKTILILDSYYTNVDTPCLVFDGKIFPFGKDFVDDKVKKLCLELSKDNTIYFSTTRLQSSENECGLFSMESFAEIERYIRNKQKNGDLNYGLEQFINETQNVDVSAIKDNTIRKRIGLSVNDQKVTTEEVCKSIKTIPLFVLPFPVMQLAETYNTIEAVSVLKPDYLTMDRKDGQTYEEHYRKHVKNIDGKDINDAINSKMDKNKKFLSLLFEQADFFLSDFIEDKKERIKSGNDDLDKNIIKQDILNSMINCAIDRMEEIKNSPSHINK